MENESVSSISEVLYDWAQRGADPDPKMCACRGRGWILSPMDTWIACRSHKGPHPEADDE